MPAQRQRRFQSVNHQLVQEIRMEVAEALSAQAGAFLPEAERRLLARRLVVELLDSRWATGTVTGQAGIAVGQDPGLLPDEEAEIVEAVMASLFGLGRLQRLIDDPEVENVDVNGHDVVWVRYADGAKVLADPVADSDEELVGLIRLAASRLGMSERRFDTARPELDLRLPDGSRMSAVMAVCERPCISIRRHRYSDLTLDDLVGLGMLSEELAGFLAAAVRARKNMIIAGAMNSGKTTLLRALASEIPPRERIVTVEQALELGLDKLVERHPDCVALEAREPNTEGEGEISMSRLVRRSLRMNADRVIVGEVLGDEVIPMLNAMSQGRAGSMCTLHSDSSAGVFRRIAAYAAQAAERLSLEAANLLIAGSIDLVVFIDSRYEECQAEPADWEVSPSGGFDGSGFTPARLVRRVASVREVIDADGPYVVSNEIWRPGPDGAAIPGVPVSDSLASDLAGHGTGEQWLALNGAGAW
jgi:pilus assembly protein CpaF